jgi:hypothetical protein
MEITPGLLHENQGYGDFRPCPFCGNSPNFAVGFYKWRNNDPEGNCVEDDHGENIPVNPAGYRLTVCCLNCTIAMKEPHPYLKQGDAEKLHTSEFYEDKFDNLQWRWNRRITDFKLPITIKQTTSGVSVTATIAEAS